MGIAGVKLVIFDLDGTLIDSLPDLTDAVNHMRAAFGFPSLAEEEVRKLVGKGTRNLVQRALPVDGASEIEQGLALFLAFNRAHIIDRSQLYPGVRETLQTLKSRGFSLALASNKNRDLCLEILSRLELLGVFTTVLGGDSTETIKPSPEPLLKIIHEHGVAPGEAVMVGDSINDMEAGKKGGLVTIGCRYGYGTESELADADFQVSSLAELGGLELFAPA